MKTLEEEEVEFRKKAEAFRETAFPVSLEFQYESNPGKRFTLTYGGMSRREYFAAMAMQGMMTNIDCSYFSSDSIAKAAVQHADALIEALNKDSE